MKNEEAVILAEQYLGDANFSIEEHVDNDDRAGVQYLFKLPRPVSQGAAFCHFCWWRVDQDENLTHCALLAAPPGTFSFSFTLEDEGYEDRVSFGTALAEGLLPGEGVVAQERWGANTCIWFDDDFRALIRCATSLERFGGVVIATVRPACPGLDRLEATFQVYDAHWVSPDVSMALSYITGVIPEGILLDWLQDKSTELSEMISELQAAGEGGNRAAREIQRLRERRQNRPAAPEETLTPQQYETAGRMAGEVWAVTHATETELENLHFEYTDRGGDHWRAAMGPFPAGSRSQHVYSLIAEERVSVADSLSRQPWTEEQHEAFDRAAESFWRDLVGVEDEMANNVNFLEGFALGALSVREERLQAAE